MGHSKKNDFLEFYCTKLWAFGLCVSCVYKCCVRPQVARLAPLLVCVQIRCLGQEENSESRCSPHLPVPVLGLVRPYPIMITGRAKQSDRAAFVNPSTASHFRVQLMSVSHFFSSVFEKGKYKAPSLRHQPKQQGYRWSIFWKVL